MAKRRGKPKPKAPGVEAEPPEIDATQAMWLPPPPDEIDAGLLHGLAMIHCTLEEAAAVLRMDPGTLKYRLGKDQDLRTVWDRGQHYGKASLRRTLWRLAQTNPRSAEFLAANILGMRAQPQRIELSGPDGKPVQVAEAERLAAAMSRDELLELRRLATSIYSNLPKNKHSKKDPKTLQ